MNCSIPDCDNPQEGQTGFCASHNWQMRKAERDAKKIKIAKPVNKVSEKRADELLQYPKLKKQYLEFKMACEMKFQGCSITATDIHHTSLSATNFLNTDTWVSCCRFCHSVCENTPAEERRRLGLLID